MPDTNELKDGYWTIGRSVVIHNTALLHPGKKHVALDGRVRSVPSDERTTCTHTRHMTGVQPAEPGTPYNYFSASWRAVWVIPLLLCVCWPAWVVLLGQVLL